ncbi:hypothetical protein CC_2376 [Caulobacter vibrioides CB15]|uniref:Uncharacterized protein n=1 Tax=Caulobacter vibrioides (strain ATCC 19089 / CIP 103742 / CB 15) TaxID=190650 RepID=Q9A5S1_CAUVC|nr:hypothetical protein CC_2376 [Caulobacter vibrioides CB15]
MLNAPSLLSLQSAQEDDPSLLLAGLDTGQQVTVLLRRLDLLAGPFEIDRVVHVVGQQVGRPLVAGEQDVGRLAGHGNRAGDGVDQDDGADLDDDHRRGPRPYGVQHDQAARAQAVELARPRNPGQQAIKAHAKGAHPHDIVGELFHPLHIGADVVQLDVRFREDHQGAPGRGKRGQSA